MTVVNTQSVLGNSQILGSTHSGMGHSVLANPKSLLVGSQCDLSAQSMMASSHSILANQGVLGKNAEVQTFTN